MMFHKNEAHHPVVAISSSPERSGGYEILVSLDGSSYNRDVSKDVDKKYTKP
jgi:hypothetical protein